MQNNMFKTEFGLIFIGAIIFVASFMWKDFLSDVEEHFFPKTDGFVGRFIYVVVITVILVIIAVHLKTMLGLVGANNIIQFDDTPIITEGFVADDDNEYCHPIR